MTNEQIAALLAEQMTDAGYEASNDPEYKVYVYAAPLEGTSLVTFMARLPETVVSCTEHSAQKIIDRFNSKVDDVRLDLSMSSYGIDLKHGDFEDYEHFSLAMYCRIEQPEEDDEDEDDGESHLRGMEAFAGARHYGASLQNAMDEYNYASGRSRAPTKYDYMDRYLDEDEYDMD
jgi:hypothetical protein